MSLSWTMQLVDVAERLLNSSKEHHFDWQTLGKAFYKRKPAKHELTNIIDRRLAIVKGLRDRGIRCQLVSDYYFYNQSWGSEIPSDIDQAGLNLPNKNGAAGVRKAGSPDIIYTAFLLHEESRNRGHQQNHGERIAEAKSSNRLVDGSGSVFRIDQGKHLSIFLTKSLPAPHAEDSGSMDHNVSNESSLPIAAKPNEDGE